jgi:hypothetical protein
MSEEKKYDSSNIKVNQINSFIDLLCRIENNPEAYLGGVTGSNSYAALVAYLNALEYSDYFKSGEHSLKNFKEWVYNKYTTQNAQDIYGWIENEYGAECAMSEFFEIFRSYRVEKQI